MKFIFALGFSLSFSAFADFVYMKEDAHGKSIQWQKDHHSPPITVNDQANKMWAIYPDISPDAKEFVYVEGPGQTDLHLTYSNPSKKISHRFHLPSPGMLLHPKFTKNGKFIFYSAPGKSGKNTIFFIDRAKEVLRQGENLVDFSLSNATALDDSEEAYFPKPSTDGNFVVYQRNLTGKKEIILFDRMENKKKILAEGMSPALSFDERLIAFTSKKDGNWNVYTIDRTSGEVKQITSDAKDEMAPSFLPDNSLAFASNKSGHFKLYHLKGTEWAELVGHLENTDYYSPQFSGETTYAQSEKAPFIGNARSSFGTVSHQGKVYMAGGHQGSEHTYPPESFTDTFIAYDIAADKWQELAPRPLKAHGYQIAAFGQYIYAFGGFAYSAEHRPRWKSLDQIDRYDIQKNRWETIGRLSTPRSSNVAVTINDKVYLAGGWNSTPKFTNDKDGTFLNSIEVFDLKLEKLEVAPFTLPLPLRRALTGVERNGKLILIGGLGVGASHFELLNQVTEIDPETGMAKELTPLPFSTFAPAAEVLGDELFVFGGMFQTGQMEYEYVSHVYGMKFEEMRWRHTGRYLKETKGFSQVFKLDEQSLGILGGHRYADGADTPVSTFETFSTQTPDLP